MLCSQCGHDNKDGAKFCNECGTKLEIACPACATVNPHGSKFCNECATPLARQSSVVSSQLSVANSQSPIPNTQHLAPNTQPPSSYTPSHLAERIRAEQAAMEARGASDG